MATKFYPVTPLNVREEVRIDSYGSETHITVYSVDMAHIDLLIQTLESIKAEYAPKPAVKPFEDAVKQLADERAQYLHDLTHVKPMHLGPNVIVDEPAEMTAVLGPKPDPTGWYRNALQKSSAALQVTTDDFGNKYVDNLELAETKPAKRSDPTTHYTCAETASFVREALKKAFPNQKFSVRSKVYSGGASITIHWLDGVTEFEVKQVVSRFEGATFDGMIDLKSNVYYNDENGTNVSYGADYIFCNRDYSKELTLKLAAQVANFESIDLPEMNAWEWFDNNIQLKDGQTFTTRLNEARYCYSATAEKYIGSRFGYLPQWIECMISMQ